MFSTKSLFNATAASPNLGPKPETKPPSMAIIFLFFPALVWETPGIFRTPSFPPEPCKPLVKRIKHQDWLLLPLPELNGLKSSKSLMAFSPPARLIKAAIGVFFPETIIIFPLA